MQDLLERKRKGIETYGVPLQAFNGRNSVQDLYEEELDKIQYLKQWILERDALIDALEYYSQEPNGFVALALLEKLYGKS